MLLAQDMPYVHGGCSLHTAILALLSEQMALISQLDTVGPIASRTYLALFVFAFNSSSLLVSCFIISRRFLGHPGIS